MSTLKLMTLSILVGNKKTLIHDGKISGIFVWKNGKGRITYCEIFGNTYSGIKIREGDTPTIRQCTIKQNGYKAIWVYDGGAGTIENCDLRDNKQGAWNIEKERNIRSG